MASLSLIRNSLIIPHIRRSIKLRRATMKAGRIRLPLYLAAALSFSIGFVSLLEGWHTPASPLSEQAIALGIGQPDEHGTATCPYEEAPSPLFASCPSFLQDYSGQAQGTVDTTKFTISNGAPDANSEAEFYTKSTQNLRIQNGSLVLEARNDPQQGFNYTSARVSTEGKENFLYGKVIVRATLPGGIGTWPAIWMLPSNSKYADLSPASDQNRYLNGGEMDIAEAVGTQPHFTYGIAHSLAYPIGGTDRSYYGMVTIPGNDTVFHDYELDWTPTSLTFRVDGTAFYTYTKKPEADYRSWPFNQPFYLILNVALGGSWGGTDTAQFPGDGIDKSALPASMKIQSIRYYSYISGK